jgi:hypothetical protein
MTTPNTSTSSLLKGDTDSDPCRSQIDTLRGSFLHPTLNIKEVRITRKKQSIVRLKPPFVFTIFPLSAFGWIKPYGII